MGISIYLGLSARRSSLSLNNRRKSPEYMDLFSWNLFRNPELSSIQYPEHLPIATFFKKSHTDSAPGYLTFEVPVFCASGYGQFPGPLLIAG